MKQFLITYTAIIARWRLFYAINAMDLFDVGFQHEIKKIWLPGQLQDVAIIEIRVKLLASQLRHIAINARHALDFWDKPEPERFNDQLRDSLQIPFFHSLKITDKELLFLKQLEDVNIFDSRIEKFFEGINYLTEQPTETILTEEMVIDFHIRAISFNGYLEMILNTDAYNKQSVQNLLEIINN